VVAALVFGIAWQAGASLVHLAAWPALAGGGTGWVLTARSRRRAQVARREFPEAWRRTLQRDVRYYAELPGDERIRFERDLALIIDGAEITGVGARVTDRLRVLVASSLVMLMFGRTGWDLEDLPEILIYPKAFDERFRCGSDRTLAGMMVPRNAIVFSKPALLWSFRHEEPYHVGLHEFAHLLDLEDGRFDGVPRGLDWDTQRRWQVLIAREHTRARSGRSVLGEHAATGEAEVFAVAVEHFFKAPRPLRARHPALYDALRAYLNQDPAATA
jgi:Mlc titration factor MtfA (ptsG expression regulator)